MPAPELLLAFTVAAFVIIVIPGPSVLFVVSRALAYGRRTAVATVAGNEAGALVLAGAVALGVGAVIQTSTVAYTAIKLAGAAYLVYLGIRAVRHRQALQEALGRQAGPLSGARAWGEGFVVGITNPKTVVFFAAVLPQFVDRSAGHPGLQMLVLGGIFVVIAFGSDAAYGLAAGAVRSWLAQSARRLELVGGAAGVAMVGLGVGLAATGRNS